MLKIKSDIDLKELEKYGFIKEEFIGDININDWYKLNWVDDNGNKIKTPNLDRDKIDWAMYTKYSNKKHWPSVSIAIFDNTEIPEFKPRQIMQEDVDIDILYDLIKADLIEKVEENEINDK